VIERKIYLYDSSQESNGYRGQDFSSHILQGNEEKEDITQELDTAEITLCGLPFSNEFDPETKFILDIWEDGVLIESATRHFCVARDIVNQPILSDDNYFDHHISFIEPSVNAQKRLVDNISVTYKLKDVNLKEVVAYPLDSAIMSIIRPDFTPSYNFGEVTISEQDSSGYYAKETLLSSAKYFQIEGDIGFRNTLGQVYNTIYNNIENFAYDNGYLATFIIPKVAIMFGNVGYKTYSKLGYASISCNIKECTTNGILTGREWSKNIISNSNLGEGSFSTINGWQDRVQGEWIIERVEKETPLGTTIDNAKFYYKKYTETTSQNPNYEIDVPIETDKKYIVQISLYQFSDNFPSISGRDMWYKYFGEQPSYYVSTKNLTRLVGMTSYITETPEYRAMTTQNTSSTTSMITYNVDTGRLVYSSSTPYSALALLQKAIINSSIYEKKDGVYIADINNSDLPFYISNEYVDGTQGLIDDLSSTAIIENFYNQKNLWEIMVDVGHYIHSIPELRFGRDDKFEITFNRLGRTDEKPNITNKVSIFNTRSVEDYICATSSYITNMVQLGGTIQEWVAPKTTNEQLLVVNDTAEIIVSKPIIELDSIIVKNNTNGQTADMTKFVYEENVYKTLDLSYTVDPNRGIALYYKLGTNVITGGQYQLPQANTNAYSDYTIKKVIWCAFNGYVAEAEPSSTAGWTQLNVNDYSFFVKYKTKDSVRQTHIRPDLRKYLLNSKYDKFPEHNQFNNQTDVVVDSVKFGNNIYGKLIKTGNSNYDVSEWNTNYSQVKHKGELYRINGELYYVANVTHQFFSSHIISSVKYSKDYNELSAVIGIPSEPRFYEISEQSLIWRELAINDVLYLTDDIDDLQYKSNFVFNNYHLSRLILASGTDFARYAITVYKGDKDIGSYDQTIGSPDLYKEVLNPINAYSSENTLTYEWDMEDNYSAGDKVIVTEKENYNSLLAVPYTDIYGKSALLDFYILGDLGNVLNNTNKVRALPESPIKTRNDVSDTRPFIGDYDILGTNVMQYDSNFNGRGIGLLKDCREALSINFNLQLATSSDTFVVSPFVFSPNKTNVRIVLLADEVNKLSNGYIDNSAIITPIDTNGNTMGQYFDFQIDTQVEQSSWDTNRNVVSIFGIDLKTLLENVNENHFNGNENYQQIKSVVVVYNVSRLSLENNENNSQGVIQDPSNQENVANLIPTKTQFVFARNVPSFEDKEWATSNIYFGAPKKDRVFINKQ
jgi:hypothetical protein